MKYAVLPLLLLAIFAVSCSKDEPKTICDVKHVPLDYHSDAKTLIPIDTRNFWLYADSVYDPQTGVLTHATVTPINIKNVYTIGTVTYFDFSGQLSPMTVVGDSLFNLVTTNTANCYELKKAFFAVSDTTVLDQATQRRLYKDTSLIHTVAGDFRDNIVYQNADALWMYFHPGVGLVKLETRVNNNVTRHTFTLKEYKVN